MTAAAARQRRCRQRQRDGLVLLQVEAPEIVVDALIIEGFLAPEVADSRAAIEAALGNVVKLWSHNVVTRDDGAS